MSPRSQSQDTLPDVGTPTTPDAPARIVWRTQYDYQRDAIERELSSSRNDEPSLTMQEFSEDADLNITLARFGIKDGSKLPGLDMTKVDPSYYGDFSNAVDLKTALNVMLEAERRFMELPAALRANFHNNWVEMHEWVSNPENIPDAIKLGMLTKDAMALLPVQPTPATPTAAPAPATPPTPTPIKT